MGNETETKTDDLNKFRYFLYLFFHDIPLHVKIILLFFISIAGCILVFFALSLTIWRGSAFSIGPLNFQAYESPDVTKCRILTDELPKINEPAIKTLSETNAMLKEQLSILGSSYSKAALENHGIVDLDIYLAPIIKNLQERLDKESEKIRINTEKATNYCLSIKPNE